MAADGNPIVPAPPVRSVPGHEGGQEEPAVSSQRLGPYLAGLSSPAKLLLLFCQRVPVLRRTQSGSPKGQALAGAPASASPAPSSSDHGDHGGDHDYHDHDYHYDHE